MYLVIGATGNIGGKVASQLIQQGHSVRAFVRDPARASGLPDSVEIAVGDLDDDASLAAAVQGVDGVFFMQAEPKTSQAESMVQAARAASVRNIVVLSSIGTRLVPLPMIGAAIEARDQVLAQSGLDVTYLRANALMTNAHWWASSIRDEGCVVDATDPGRTTPVDPDDIARVAVLALTQDGHAGHGYILNGPDALTAREQAAIIADVLGRSIDFVAVTPEEMAQQSAVNGTQAWFITAMRDLNELFRAGRAGVLADDIKNLTGTAPSDFRSWCQENIMVFR